MKSKHPIHRRSLRTLLPTSAAWLLCIGASHAQVVFFDDFDAPNDTLVVGRPAPIGGTWDQPGGGVVRIQGGVVNTTGGARTFFVNFAEGLDGSPRVLKFTIDFASLSNNAGWAGVSLYEGTTERIFIGDRSGNQGSIGFQFSGGPGANSGTLVGEGVVTLTYDYQSGTAMLFEGEDINTEPLATVRHTANMNIDRLRIANNDGGDVAISSLRAELLEVGPVSVDSLTLDRQIVLSSDEVIIGWQTSFADEVSISPEPGSVAGTGMDFVNVPPGDAVYEITATDTVRGITRSRSVPIRSVIGGEAEYRYVRFTTVKTRNPNVTLTQLAEFTFFSNGTQVAPVAVTNPGGSNPGHGMENPEMVIDGNNTTKWLDFNKAPLVFDFGAPAAFDSYGFATGNDAPERDPVRWIMEGSNDNESWTLIENVTAFDYQPPTARMANTDVIPLPGASLLPYVSAGLVTDAPLIFNGDSATLTWQSYLADSVVLNDGTEDIPLGSANGSISVSPTEPTTYTLTATGQDGVTATAEVTVQVISPIINTITYPNFNQAGEELALLGAAALVNDPDRPLPGPDDRLRITPDSGSQVGTVWFRRRQNVGAGFESNFGIHMGKTTGGNGADGMAFIIQNAPGGTATLVQNAETGPLANALTIAFDGYQNGEEPSAALLRVASAGTELALVNLATIDGITLGSANNLTDPTGQLAPHQIRVTYEPGSLSVFMDGVQILDSLEVNLDTLGAVDAEGKAFVGFAARTGGLWQSHDVTSWFLTTGEPSTPAGGLTLVTYDLDPDSGDLSLTWIGDAEKTYRITASDNLTNWSTVLRSGIAGQNGPMTAATTFTGDDHLFFRVEEE